MNQGVRDRVASTLSFSSSQESGLVIPLILMAGIRYPRVSACLGTLYIAGRFFSDNAYEE
jgi:hypothetical protein